MRATFPQLCHCFILAIYCISDFCFVAKCWGFRSVFCVCVCVLTVLNQTRRADFYGSHTNSLNFFSVIQYSCLLPQFFKETDMAIWTAKHFASVVQKPQIACPWWLRWCAASSITHVKMFQRNEASTRYMTRMFKYIFHNWQVSMSHVHSCSLLVYREIMCCPKLKLCSINPEYCGFIIIFFLFLFWG